MNTEARANSRIARQKGHQSVLADDSDVMRDAILGLFKSHPEIEIAGEATSFAETLRCVAVLKPDVVLIDLHMKDESEYPPELVKSQILLSTQCTLAISVWNDDDAKALGRRFGAQTLLDKANLFSTLIPAIKMYCPDVITSENPSGDKPDRTHALGARTGCTN